MSFKEAVSQRIYELLDKYGYSVNRIAELAAVPTSTLRALLENRVDNPSSYVIFKVCRALRISLEEFYSSDLFSYDNIND